MDIDIKRLVGKFSIPRELIMTNPDVVLKIMGTVIVIRAEHMLETDQLEYVGYSPAFDDIDPGEKTPTYDIGYDPDSEEVSWTRTEA